MRKVNCIARVFGITIALSAVAWVTAQAQDLRPVHFSGLIHDYSPSTVSGGPYEIRGAWSLDVIRGGTANTQGCPPEAKCAV